MPASIKFDQTTIPAGVAGKARNDGVLGQLVTCSSGSPASSYLWTLLDVPIRSALSRGLTGSSATFSFTPDVKGTYLVSLRLNGSLLTTDNAKSFIAVVSSGTNTLGWRYLGASEENNDNIARPGLGFPGNVNVRGWATERDLQMEETEEAAARVLGAVVVSPGIGQDALVKLDSTTGQLDPSVVPGAAASVGIKYNIESTDVIVVPNRYQYLVQGAIVIDPGGSLTAAPGGQIVILP